MTEATCGGRLGRSATVILVFVLEVTLGSGLANW